MKTVLCHAFGEPDSLRVEEIEPRPLERGQVRISVRAAGVNFPDLLMVEGKYQIKPSLPFIPGMEAAGEIIECAPEVTDLHPGQRVLALARRGGAFASELIVPAPFVVPIPEIIDFTTAAGFPVAYGTAHLALIHRGHLRSGETLLVTGAGGGVGLAAVEVGKRLGGLVRICGAATTGSGRYLTGDFIGLIASATIILLAQLFIATLQPTLDRLIAGEDSGEVTYLLSFSERLMTTSDLRQFHGLLLVERARLVVDCIVDRAGILRNLKVVEGAGSAMAARMIAALHDWRFRPVLRGNEAVEVHALLGFDVDTR